MSLRLFVPCAGQIVHPYAQCRPQAIFQSVALSSTPTAGYKRNLTEQEEQDIERMGAEIAARCEEE